MEYRFKLNDTEIEEPIGWIDFELSMNRDDLYHGMQFEASTGPLQFFGAGANYLRTQKNTNGISSNVTFTAEERCNGNETFGDIIIGRMNFGKYKDTCGARSCLVSIPFEEEGCKVIFKNRFDQKVDLENLFALDNQSVLADYAQLGQTISVPAKALQSAVDGSVAEEGWVFENEAFATTVFFRPEYTTERYNNILTGQLTGGNNCEDVGAHTFDSCPGPITPQLLFEDNIECFDGNFTYLSRMKGRFEIGVGDVLVNIQHKIIKWDAIGNIYDDGDVIAEGNIFFDDPGEPGPLVIEFDNTLSGTTTIEEGIGFYAVLEIGALTASSTLTFDTETTIRIEAIKICPPTNTQYFMVHETLSRVAEAITNKCVRVKSEYYGRIDSQPYAFDADGCGSLRMLTSGLKLRNAPDGKFFASMKDLMSGLNAIDNIGFDIVEDEAIPNAKVMRIEPIANFYLDQEIIRLDNVAAVSNEVQEAWHYAKINAGYKKWEVEGVNGLNEIHSTREYRTNVDTINTTLDIQSNFVAGSYPIELTRQQSFAESGAADTTFDNETFIICLQRSAYAFLVEQGKVIDDVNIFDAPTIFNYRISPVRNLMRWFKSIVNTYPGITSSLYRLFFNAGTANFLAIGLLDDATACRLENFAMAENATIGTNNFTDQAQATPLFKNETATFDYPLSMAQYKAIKAAPYGYVAYTCGNDTTVNKGFIKDLKYKPARGMANFTLRKKWGQ